MLTYSISGPWAGELVIIPRPRGEDWLNDEVINLKKQGFEMIVSLLTCEEIEELGLSREAEALESLGLQYCNYPIQDRGVPSSNESAQQLMTKIHRDLLAGRKIALHCRTGIGRAGLIASSVLVIAGVEPREAIREVSEARGLDSPETAEQREWVMALARVPVPTT